MVVRQRHLLEPREERVPHVVFDVTRRADQNLAHQKAEESADDGDAEQDGGVHQQLRPRNASVEVVDRPLQHPRRQQLNRRRDQHARQAGRKRSLVSEEKRQEFAERGGHPSGSITRATEWGSASSEKKKKGPNLAAGTPSSSRLLDLTCRAVAVAKAGTSEIRSPGFRILDYVGRRQSIPVRFRKFLNETRRLTHIEQGGCRIGPASLVPNQKANLTPSCNNCGLELPCNVSVMFRKFAVFETAMLPLGAAKFARFVTLKMSPNASSVRPLPRRNL